MKAVLIVTGGATPQVVTETVWKLHERGPAYMPAELFVVVTSYGEALFTRALKSKNGQLAGLCTELDVPMPKVSIEVPRIGRRKIADVRTAEDAAAYGTHVTRLVRDQARDPDTLIHVSVAGGRKTMSYYAGAALGLFGRPHDELSHVLVEPAWFEDCPDYWWPYRTPRQVEVRLRTADGVRLERRSTKGSRVDMVMTPFVPLGVFLAGRDFFRADLDYAEVVTRLNATLAARRLVIDLPTHSVALGGQVAVLDAQPFALYALIATATRDRWIVGDVYLKGRQPQPGMISLQSLVRGRIADAAECGEHRGALLDLVYALLYARTGVNEGNRENLSQALAGIRSNDRNRIDRFLKSRRSQMSKITKAFASQLGNPWLADRLAIRATDDGTNSWYWLAFEPHEIEIRG
ncbi:MAG: TIGR02584 family CRISPR-associated protein [Reyranella sp.]|uniref:CRISPR-associated ring nuclease Csm6 n=1 Tax=Reyranella sp. TaxID=1929291 RepID=UPI001221C858|nr:CRISPR-associated ring nuclease Csm6 [Reyranella sp.]TAJ42785.1 MAG: TIGR02584 family CRISPR-associated protein [Reyranella sp.]